MSKERYRENRARVAKIYGLEPDEVSCHHIIEKSDVKKRGGVFEGYDVDQLSNLYPFKVDGKGSSSSEHTRTHQLIERNEPQANTPKRKRKGRTVYKRKKKRR